jgi:hypothetical protein
MVLCTINRSTIRFYALFSPSCSSSFSCCYGGREPEKLDPLTAATVAAAAAAAAVTATIADPVLSVHGERDE